MKRKIRIWTAILLLVGVAMAAFSGCKDSVKYDKYEYADRYRADGGATYAEGCVKEIEVDWVNGTIEIEQSPSGEVQVVEENELEAKAERMHYYLDDEGVLMVKYCESGLRGSIDSSSKNLRLMIPTTLSVDLRVMGAKVTIGNVQLQELSLENVSGNISAERIVCNKIDLDIVSGEINVAELSASASFSLDSVSGDVSVVRLSANSLDVDTVSGKLEFGLAAKCQAEIESASGDVTLVFLEDLGAKIYFRSGSGSFECKKSTTQEGGYYYVVGAEESVGYDIVFKSVSGKLKIE